MRAEEGIMRPHRAPHIHRNKSGYRHAGEKKPESYEIKSEAQALLNCSRFTVQAWLAERVHTAAYTATVTVSNPMVVNPEVFLKFHEGGSLHAN